MNITNFPKMAIPMMAIFVKNFKNHIQGEFVIIREFALVINFVIFPEKGQLRLENEIFEISRNSAYPYYIAILKIGNRFDDQFQ